MTSRTLAEWCFSRCAAYAELRAGREDGVADPAEYSPALAPPERLLQCVWYDPALRPERLVTVEGETVAVEQPGAWNLEAGPDFLGAVIRVGPDRRRICGDVEIHVRPADWASHHHSDDPRYARVRVHVTWQPARAGAGNSVPPGCVQISLRDLLASRPGFSMEDIDATAYPYAARTVPAPCTTALAVWSPDQRERLLSAAGEERLRRKAERMARAIVDRGPEQVFFEEVLAALGYRHNKTPFRRLAEYLPLESLRREAGGDEECAYALLAGAGGLLPASPGAAWDSEAREHHRRLWDAWWKCPWRSRPAPLFEWRLAGLRPLNHPGRRLAAAAWLFTRAETPFARLVAMADQRPPEFLRASARLLDVEPHGFWARRLSFGGARQAKPTAFVGPDRIQAILINVVVPLLAAAGVTNLFAAGLLDALPPVDDNGILRQTAHLLFGPDHPPSLYRDGLRRQGLLQIFHDFCLNDRSHCATCPLPAALRQRGGEAETPFSSPADRRRACRPAGLDIVTRDR